MVSGHPAQSPHSPSFIPSIVSHNPNQEFACNGTVIDDEKAGKIIQLQGDQRSKMTNFLVDEGVEKDIIKVHGF
jgi:translation initiation factor SUI1